MAIITYPLNGIEYSAEDAETYLCTRTSGVFSADDNFAASVTGDMTITVSPGIAWIQNTERAGKSVVSTSPVELQVPMADGTRPRIDRVVLRFDKAANRSSLAIKAGEPSSRPSAPGVERTELVYELGLYTIYVLAGATQIYETHLVPTMMDEAVCGLMRDGVTGIPTSQLQSQVQALISELREVIDGVEGGSENMLKSYYDPDGTGILIERGGTGATTAEAARENLGITLPLSVQNGGTGATTAEAARENLEFGTPIWTGEWSNGSIEISRLLEYSTYKITIIDADTVIIANRKGTALRGVGAYYSTNNVAHIYIMSATVSGNRLTYQNVIDMGFSSSGFRTIQETAGISGIYGIV